MAFDDALREGTRPVRRGLSPAKRAQLMIEALDAPSAAPAAPAAGPSQHSKATATKLGDPKEDACTKSSLLSDGVKTEAEIARIVNALSRHFLFERLGTDKIYQLALAMRRRTAKEDEVIFSQGQYGNTLYIVEDGEFVASVKKDGDARALDLFTYEVNEPHGPNPCFGELAVVHVALSLIHI